MTYPRHFGRLSEVERNRLRFGDWSEDKWALSALVGLFLFAGIAMYAFSGGNHPMTAMAPADETSGQSTRPALPTRPN
jgi:hypothetical protein